ncbi:hypothetical protein GCM10027403_10160 [Arthrobacter tecti]
MGERIEPLAYLNAALERVPRGVVVVILYRLLRLAVRFVQLRGSLAREGSHAVADCGEVCNAPTGVVELFLLMALGTAERGDWINRLRRVAAGGDDPGDTASDGHWFYARRVPEP